MSRGLFRKTVTFVGDWGMLYLALFLMIAMRYGTEWPDGWVKHLRPFSLLFPVWILILYVNYLYETRFFRPSIDSVRTIGNAVIVAFVASLSLFYLFPPGLVHPRRNLLIFAIIAWLLLLLWRVVWYRLSRRSVGTNILFVGQGEEIKELADYLKRNPELQYHTKKQIPSVPGRYEELDAIIRNDDIKLVLFKPEKASGAIKNLFPIMASGVMVLDLEDFYERTLNKVSPSMLDNVWFIRNLENVTQDIHEVSKRIIDIAVGLAGLAVLILAVSLLAIIIRLDSPGPAIFRQARVGKNGRIFRLYKLRTMRAISKGGSAEGGSATWTGKNDPRITKVGKFLRNTRMDELPQLWNVLIGDMSIVGPRPERPELVKKLTEKIPCYNMRHLVKPGLTGWAQINYEYGDSVKDARIKLQYDVYYTKKRTLVLDLTILLKTAKIILSREGR
ncbi:MAG: sugar transferase [Candidatus Colwellbacteria bacterium]|nr:sugar transferase [Candidatus Colwellbacteria bacterium]